MFTNKNPTDDDYERWGYDDDWDSMDDYEPTDAELDAIELDITDDDENYDTGYLDDLYLGREY